jgi:putative flippase GtrA
MHRIIRFLISGGCAAVTEYGIFYLLTSGFDLYILLANTISFMGGLLVSFLLNRQWVFRSTNSKRDEFIKYSVLAMVNLIISNGIIHILADTIGNNEMIAKLITMIMIAAWNYLIFSRLIFGTNERDSL